MIGSLIGDIVGSVYEWNNIKTKDFPLFQSSCFPTDDSIMTLAVGKALLESHGDNSLLPGLAVKYMQEYGRRYPDAGYGGRFSEWLREDDPKSYGSWGNGSAMRVSVCGFAAASIYDAIEKSELVTAVTHDHPEGIRGAEATAAAIFLARQGMSISEIKRHICENYYDIDFTIDGIRDSYMFNESCMDTVPQALECVFEAASFEDAIRNAISIGGDSDTVAAIAGPVAEAVFGVPHAISDKARSFLDGFLLSVCGEIENAWPSCLI